MKKRKGGKAVSRLLLWEFEIWTQRLKLCPLGMELIKRLQWCSVQSLPPRFTGYGGRADEWMRRDATTYGKGSVLGGGGGRGGEEGTEDVTREVL